VRQLPIGLDIGTATLRMLQLGGGERDLRLVDAARVAIPAEVREDAKARRMFVVESVRHLLKERRFRGREVVMGLGMNELAVRNVRMPKMADAELAEAIGWEAQNKFPFDTATAVVQHVRAGEVRQGDQVLDEIILLAVPRATVEHRVELANEAGLDIVSLDAGPAAAFRGFDRFLRRREDEAVISVFVDLGMQTTVIITRGRDIVFVKSIPIGGAVFNRAVAESLELGTTEAEALRRRLCRRGLARKSEGEEADESDEPEAPDRVARAVADAMRPHLEDLADEIGLCLRYYGVTFRGERPESVVFCGGEAHNASIPAALGQRLAMEAKIGDPLRNVRVDQADTAVDRRGIRAEWATAAGMSLKGFLLDAPVAPSHAR
jgi:type IV pilus assembly protein PilM